MSTVRMPAGEFNHFPARARKLADEHDVVIEAHGHPTAVIMSFERYCRLTQSNRTPLQAIAESTVADIDFDIPRFGEEPTPADL